MRLSHTLLMASVAVLSLPSCSSASGPGEIGTADQIVVRNHGDAPLPPSAVTLAQADTAAGHSETVLEGDVPPDPEMTATKEGAADPAAADPATMEAVPAPSVDATATTSTTATTPTTSEAATAAPVQSDARPAETAAGSAPMASPDVESGGEVRPNETVDPAGAVIEDASSPQVEQAADEFQNKGADAAAAEAMQNAPAAAAPVQEKTPRAPTPKKAKVKAPVEDKLTNYPAVKGWRPSPEDIANGGTRVITTDQGMVEQQFTGTPAPAQPAPMAPPAPGYASPAAPVPPAPVRTYSQGYVSPSAAPANTIATPPAAPAQQIAVPAPTGAVSALSMTDSAMLTRVQQALAAKGFYRGPVDGQNSSELLNALSQYQSASGMQPGPLDEATARSLGVIQ